MTQEERFLFIWPFLSTSEPLQPGEKTSLRSRSWSAMTSHPHNEYGIGVRSLYKKFMIYCDDDAPLSSCELFCFA